MRVIIAGGRDYSPNSEHENFIKKILISNKCTEVVSGGARGADSFGENISKSMNIPVKVFKAEWDKYGKAAGHIRNKKMAKYADGCILLPGGTGTANMKKNAEIHNLKIKEIK